MRPLLCLIFGVLLVCGGPNTHAEISVRVDAAPATLRVWNRDIAVLRATLNNATPEERAERVHERILALPPLDDPAEVGSEEAKIGSVEGHAIVVRHAIVFFLVPQDLDPTAIETMDTAVGHAVANLREVLQARAQQSRIDLVLRQVALAVAATLALFAVLWLLGVTRRLGLRAAQRLHRRVPSPLIGAGFTRILASVEAVAARVFTSALGLFAVYAWLAFVLSRFPYTKPWGAKLGTYLFNLLGGFANAVLNAIPGLFAAVVIFFVAHQLARAVSGLLARVESGRATFAWLYPETAKATRWLALTLIWLFAVIVAYPYIPGSDSVAFKGISVFAGLMLTIGSSGFVGHILSGLIVVYSKALRTGEMVKVGDTVGIVSDIGAFTTRVVTARGEQVSIPNSVLVASTTTNYTRLAEGRGTLLTTTVTIGYDAPWRQVHSMLELAASRTPGLRAEPRPYVLQRALSDFYVQYELRAHLERVDAWFAVQSDLHGHIQDVFNEYGVQIMSPHFMVQPANAAVVPKSRWHAPPADGVEPAAPRS